MVEVHDHAINMVLDAGNPHHTGRDVWKVAQLQIDLGGEAFIGIGRNKFGVPSTLWPLAPHWVMGTPSEGHPVFRISWKEWQAELPEDDIIWLRKLNPVDPYGRGSGIARALADELETDEYSAQYVKAFFLNGGTPDSLVYVDTTGAQDNRASKAETDRLEESWNNQHLGATRRHKTMFVSQKLGVHEFDKSLQGIKLEALRDATDRRVLETWGAPPEILGRLTNSNRSTIDSAQYLWALNVITPRLEFLREHLQRRLCSAFPADDLVLTYDSVIPQDHEHIRELIKSNPAAFSLDEIREEAGLQPLPDNRGQQYQVPVNFNVVARPSDAGRSFRDV